MPGYKGPYMTIKDMEELGLTPEVAPTVDREIMVPDDGIYLGQNGRKYEDMNFVGSGEFTPVTNWYGMPEGYTMVTNPYSPVSPDKGAERRKMAEAAGVKVSDADVDFLSDDEFQATIDNKLGFAAAQAAGDEEGMNYYRDAQNAMRMAKGYYGGVDGMLYNGVMVNTGGLSQDQYDQYVSGQEWVNGLNQELGGINSANIGQYVSQYQQQIDALSAAILGRGKFSYNKDTDPLYQQYQESYTRGGQRGMQDTLGQVAARTGGIASSYATAAAQQTYNNYMEQLADKVPELRQLAYSMYMDELNGQRSDLSMLMGLEQDAFNRFANERDFAYGVSRDQVADSQWQQNFAYQQAMDALAQQNWEKEFGYGVQQDALAQQNWQTQFDYGAQQDAIDNQYRQDAFEYGKEQDALAQQNYLNELAQAQQDNDYDKALTIAKLLASAGDFSGYKALGMTDEQIAMLTNAYQAELQAGSGSYSGGGGQTGGAGIWDVITGMDDKFAVYDYLLGQDLTNTQLEQMMSNWQQYQNQKVQRTEDVEELETQYGETPSGNFDQIWRDTRADLADGMDPGEILHDLQEAVQDGELTQHEYDIIVGNLGI